MTNETDKIEQDIDRSRTALNDTIERLGGKLSPGQMVDEALGLVQGQFGQLGANLGKQVRDNPIPLLLIGAGIGMLVLNNGRKHEAPKLSEDDWRAEHHFRKIETARSSAQRNEGETEDAWKARLHDVHAKALDIKQAAGEAYDAFQARVTRTVEGLERRASHVRDSVSGGFSKASAFVGEQAKHAGEMASGARHQAVDFYDHNPLAAGAIGIAVGALIGTLAPLSSLERDKLQGVADDALRTGANLAERGANAVEKAAASIVH
ncbi:MAG: DUF3618 domain-containing protein [Hyphomonadaceae bacterium]